MKKLRFYSAPDKLTLGHKLGTIIHHLGHELVYEPWDATHVVHTDYRDISEILTEESSLRLPIINGGCLDVRKSTLDKYHEETFGYGTLIDPKKHVGLCVEKSDKQATHSGRLVNCPYEPRGNKWKYMDQEFGFVYQKFIDTRVSGGTAIRKKVKLDTLRDIRVPVIGNEIPCVFVKEFGTENMFHVHNEGNYEVRLEDPAGHFSNIEMLELKLLAYNMGCDFCELDVLRGNFDGKIYIVDLNNVPAGDLFLKLENKGEAISMMAESFKKFLKKL